MDQSFKTAIKGTYADLKNLGGQYAGASTGGGIRFAFQQGGQQGSYRHCRHGMEYVGTSFDAGQDRNGLWGSDAGQADPRLL